MFDVTCFRVVFMRFCSARVLFYSGSNLFVKGLLPLTMASPSWTDWAQRTWWSQSTKIWSSSCRIPSCSTEMATVSICFCGIKVLQQYLLYTHWHIFLCRIKLDVFKKWLFSVWVVVFCVLHHFLRAIKCHIFMVKIPDTFQEFTWWKMWDLSEKMLIDFVHSLSHSHTH